MIGVGITIFCVAVREETEVWIGMGVTLDIQDERIKMVRNAVTIIFVFITSYVCKELPNGLRYLRWGVDGEAVQPEK